MPTYVCVFNQTSKLIDITLGADSAPGVPGSPVVLNGSGLIDSGLFSVAFDGISSGTNTTATMTVDTGASIVVSGSGVVEANQLWTVLVSSTPPAPGNVLTASSPTAAAWQPPTSGPLGFDQILTGVNSTATMTVAPGAALTFSSIVSPPAVGMINANEIYGVSISAVAPAPGQALVATSPTEAEWGNPTAAAAGADTQIQYNQTNALGADANFTWAYATQVLSVVGRESFSASIDFSDVASPTFLTGDWTATNTTGATTGTVSGIDAKAVYDGSTVVSTTIDVQNRLSAETTSGTADDLASVTGLVLSGAFFGSGSATCGLLQGLDVRVKATSTDSPTVTAINGIHIQAPTGFDHFLGTTNCALLIEDPTIITDGVFPTTYAIKVNGGKSAFPHLTHPDPGDTIGGGSVEIGTPAEVGFSEANDAELAIYRNVVADADLFSGTGIYAQIDQTFRTVPGFSLISARSWNLLSQDFLIESTANISRITGIVQTINHGVAGTVDYIAGINTTVGPSNGSTAEAFGGDFLVAPVSGTITLGAGVRSIVQTIGGTFVDGRAGMFGVIIGSSDITNAANLYAVSPDTSGGGTISHMYGLYVEDQTINLSNNPDPWGIFEANPTEKNALGSVLIGGHLGQQSVVSPPSSNQDLAGQITITNGNTDNTYSFANAFNSPPVVVVTPTSDPSSDILTYWVTSTTNDFTVNVQVTPGTSVTFNYVVIGNPD